MWFKNTARVALSSSLIASALACDPAETRPIGDNPPLQTIEASSALATANGNLRANLLGGALSAETIAALGILSARPDSTGCAAPGPGEPVVCDPPADDLEAEMNQMADEIAARVLNIENVESQESTMVRLRLRPEIACAESDGTPDADCVQMLTQLPVTVELTSRRANDIDARIRFGSSAIIETGLHQTQLSVELDFAALLAVMQQVEQITGDDLELPDRATGRVRVELTAQGPEVYQLLLGILAPIDIAGSADGERYAVKAGVANPAISLHIDGITPELSAQTNWGAIDLELPFAVFEGSPETCVAAPGEEPVCNRPEPVTASATLGVHVPASSASLLVGADEVVRVTGARTSGPMTATINGLPLFSVDLNANSGRQLDLEASEGQNGVLIKVKPSLQLLVDLDLRNLVSLTNDEIPSWALDEIFELRLDGAAEPTVELRGVSDSGNVSSPDPGNGGAPAPEPLPQVEELLKVISGNLSISAQRAGQSVQVGPGMCLMATEPTTDPAPSSEPHPISLLSGQLCE